jgi:predicted  nucleic acid-binding Zn-ribbon protein
MNISAEQSAALAKLADIDEEIASLKHQIGQLVSGAALEQVRADLMRASTTVTELRHRSEDIEAQLARADADLELVKARIKRDTEMMNSTSSHKEIEGHQRELAVLAGRATELEETELALLAELEAVQKDMAKESAVRESWQSELHALESSLNDKIEALKVQGRKHSADRQIVAPKVGDELLEIYAKKAQRGTPVGRISGRECTAWRMRLRATDFDRVISAPHDQVVYCPECQAILIR